MKLKGVNAFEQHVEKIVLIAVSAVFLIVLAMQFLLEPNRVKVLGAKEAVPPGKAFLAVETKAKELQGLMTAPADSVLPQVQKIDLVNALTSRRTTSLTGGRVLVIGPAPVIEGAKSGLPATGADRIQPLEVPAPARVLAVNHSNTFSPTEPVTNPALKPLLPQEQPLDKHSVTIACSFDGTALKDSLGKGEGAVKPMPSNWYRDALELMAVKVERQEQKPDGSWGDAVVIDPPPGRLTLAEALKGVHGSADLADVVAEAASSTDDLLRPDFYSTIAGDPFKAPMDLNAPTAAAAAAPKEVQDLIRERKEKVASVERLKKSKADLEKEQPRNAAPRGGGGGGGGKGAGGGGGGGGGDGGAREAERQQKERQARLDNFDKLIKQAEDRIAVIDTKLTELGFDTDGKPGAPVAANPAGQPNAPAAAAKPLLDNPDVRVWTHDLTVAPGKTYRYRMMVAVNNPAFARTSALVKEQQDLAGSPLVYSAASPWSEPIQVMADQYYFVTSAQEADNLGPARATTEVFRFFYGYYRRGAVNLEPGDSIVTTIKLPDPNKLPIYDMTALKDGVLPPAPGVPAPAVAPQNPPRDGGGKGGGGGGGKGGNLAPQQEERPAAQPGQEPGKVALPPNSKPYGKPTVSAAFDLILLDVAKTLGYTGEARSQAYFRGDQGKIVVAVPDEERKLAVWNAVVQSAKDGETQGVQAPTDTKDPNKAPTVKPPKEKTPKPGPGGGGGGGAN